MRSASILIVHADRKVQRIVQRVLGTTGHRLEVADDLEQGADLIDHLSPTLVVVDARAALSPSGTAQLASLEARSAAAWIAVLDCAHAAQVSRILELAAITHLLVHPMPVLGEELIVTAQKLLRADLFGAEKYLSWGTELYAASLGHVRERATAVAALADQVRARGQSARVASMAMLVTDELLSNAIHHAPIDDRGARYRAELPRDADLPLDDRHQVTLRWGCDGRYLALEVSDAFGSLDRDAALRALVPSEARAAGSGAGMGIALAYRSCDHLVFNLAPRQRTQVIALLDVRCPPSERVPASSYNVFVAR